MKELKINLEFNSETGLVHAVCETDNILKTGYMGVGLTATSAVVNLKEKLKKGGLIKLPEDKLSVINTYPDGKNWIVEVEGVVTKELKYVYPEGRSNLVFQVLNYNLGSIISHVNEITIKQVQGDPYQPFGYFNFIKASALEVAVIEGEEPKPIISRAGSNIIIEMSHDEDLLGFGWQEKVKFIGGIKNVTPGVSEFVSKAIEIAGEELAVDEYFTKPNGTFVSYEFGNYSFSLNPVSRGGARYWKFYFGVAADEKEPEYEIRYCPWTFHCQGPAERFMKLLLDGNSTQEGIVARELEEAVATFKRNRNKPNAELINYDTNLPIKTVTIPYREWTGNRSKVRGVIIGVKYSLGENKSNPKDDLIIINFKMKYLK